MKSRKKNVLGAFNIDFDNFDARDSDGNYLFESPYVVSVRRQSVYLPGWTGKDIAAVNEQINIYTELPIPCMGKNCLYADTCPLIKNSLVKRWADTNLACPIESIEAYRIFAGYVNDLEIEPENFTDIQIVCDLVRLNLQMKRLDKLLRKVHPLDVTVIGTDAKTTLKHELKQPSSYLQAQRLIRAEIDKLYDKLLASRKSKMDVQLKSKDGVVDLSTQMADILAQASKIEKENNVPNNIGTRMEKLELE